MNKATEPPTIARCFWLRCERPAEGLQPAEVWYAAAGYTQEMANKCREDVAKMWPNIKYTVQTERHA